MTVLCCICNVMYVVCVEYLWQCPLSVVYACTVLYVLQCPFNCCVYTSTCIEGAVVMSIECEFLWYSNSDIMIIPVSLPVNWGNTLTRNKPTTGVALLVIIACSSISGSSVMCFLRSCQVKNAWCQYLYRGGANISAGCLSVNLPPCCFAASLASQSPLRKKREWVWSNAYIYGPCPRG